MPDRLSHVAALLSALLIVTAHCSAAEHDTFRLPADAELISADVKLGLPRGAAPTGEELTAEARRLVEEYPAIDFDPALKGKQLGGIDSCFQYVRDQIRFESYPGVFRGAKGAYAARAGNADDRALLLAALLKANGIESRFAIGHLAAADSQKLLDHMFDSAAPRSATNAPEPGNMDFVSRLRARALRDYSVVLGTMGDKLPATAGVTSRQLLDEISDHVWLQAKDGDKWIDLDPSFPDATPGKAPCAADQTVDELPAARFQRVSIRVICEQLDGGTLKPSTMLEVSRPVVDLIDRQIFLFHCQEGGLGNAIAGITGGWMPVLWIGGQVETGKPVHFDEGNADDKAPAHKGIGAALDVLGGAPAPATNSGPQFVAEFVEFQLMLPGGRNEVVRRTLCDRGSATWRLSSPLDPKALRPLKRGFGGPIAAQTLHNICFSSGRHDMASYSQAISLLNDSMQPAARDSAPPANAAKATAELDFGYQVWPLALQNLATVLWADQVFLPALNDDPHVHCYLDSPRIVLFSLSALPRDGAPDRMTIESEVDLRRDSIRAVAKQTADEKQAVRRKIWFGLLEGSLEHEISAQAAFALGGDGSQAFSTSALLGAPGAKLLRPKDGGQSWEKLAADRENAAKLAAALADGDSLVVANNVLSGGPSGWWAISSTADARAVLVENLNGGRFGISGNYIPRGPAGGNSGGGGIYRVYPDGTSRPLGRMGPNGTQKGGGNEYTTILANVSVPGAVAVGSTITPKVLIAVGAVIAALAWYDFH